MALALRPFENRRAARDEVSFRTAIALLDAAPCSAFVVDVSPLGLRARMSRAAKVGDAVAITLPAVGRWTGTVRWALAGRAGIEFDTAIPIDTYARLLATAPQDAPRFDEC